MVSVSTGRYANPGYNVALGGLRGKVLRLVRRRALAITVGLALVVPAAWIQVGGPIDAWWAEGLALIIGATGLAILWAGLTGPRPDWIDDKNN